MKTIICVDDEKTVLETLQVQLMHQFGSSFNYEIAISAEEAFEIIEELNADNEEEIFLIISDWQMPGMKGDELLMQIHKLYPDIKKILLTGHASEEAIKRLLTQNIIEFILTKPWTEDLLYQKIQQLL